MSNTIAFVSRIGDEEQHRWLLALQSVLPDHRIVTIDQMSDDERHRAEVAIVANPDPVDLSRLPNLKWVQSLWAGVERMISELPDTTFSIVRMADPQMAATMAEAVLAWTLYLHRDMPRYREQQSQKLWLQHDVPLPGERTVGILGLGHLGQCAAAKLVAQDFHVCGWRRSACQVDGVETFSGDAGLNEMLAQTDILVCLLPLTDQTRGLLNVKRLAILPQGAALINFARGPIIDDSALIEILDSGHLRHAVLDVFDSEPLPSESPYWDNPNVTVLPHISAPTNRTTASIIAADNIQTFLQTSNIPTGVDRETGY